ncbi:tail fiber assembly protein [Pseudoalteromonas rubra]|uniref:Phage tail assembly chaperone-like domain-containing protein n=1 Tax=Pseudoalteromonas rubra TaxID=43658 RepID=A0A5S3WYA0_9GAMM|nr:tail fiber assembly protein [Pseudoalteromonas rubra]TMP35516.1 hypothetical protein CWB98_16000 [Pseudoalteromonas rubra]
MKIYVDEQLVALHGGVIGLQEAAEIAGVTLERTVLPGEVNLVCTEWNELRLLRDQALAESDFTQVTDSPLSDELKQAWCDYRHALRELPANFDTPEQVIWPSKPV